MKVDPAVARASTIEVRGSSSRPRKRARMAFGAIVASASLLFATAGVAGASTLPNSATQRASSTTSPTSGQHVQMSSLSKQVIASASRYVTVTGYHATLSPAFNKVASPKVVQQVEQAIANYNALPTTAKASSGRVYSRVVSPNSQGASSPSKVGGPVPDIWLNGCSALASVNYYWWGSHYWMNDCAANWVAGSLAAGAGIAGMIVLLAPAAAPIAGAVAAVLGGIAGGLWMWTSGCELAGYPGIGVTLAYWGNYPTC